MIGLLLRVPRWLLTALCVSAVLYLTLWPDPLPDNDISFWEHTDKVVHAIMMGGIWGCAAIDIWRGRRPSVAGAAWLTLGVILFGGAIELAQGAMNLGRGADWADLAADACGAVLAIPAYLLLIKHQRH